MLIIFDWDGTLIDSTAKIVRCMQLAARDAALPELEAGVIQNIIGLGLPEAISALYPSVSQRQKDALRDHYAEHFVHRDQTPSPFFPSVVETLTLLKARGHLLAVATGKSRRGLDRVLDLLGMEDFFHATRCADETASKPHPRMLEELLGEFAVSAAEAMMVGDTEYDMAMAQSIAMPRVAVSYGAHHVDRLLAYQPLVCIDALAELTRHID